MNSTTIRIVEIPPDAPEKWDIADAIRDGWNEEKLLRLIDEAKPGSTDFHDGEAAGLHDELVEKRDEKKDKTKRIMNILSRYRLIGHEGKGYLVNNIHAYQIGSLQYKNLVNSIIWRELRDSVPEKVLKEVADAQMGQALFGSSHSEKIYMRVAAVDDYTTYIDLGDEEERVVKITPEGFCLVKDPDIIFLKPGNQKALPIPHEKGDCNDLFWFKNLSNEDDKYLILSVLLYWLRGLPAHRKSFCGMDFVAPEGTAKSTICKMIKEMIDPNVLESKIFPDNRKEVFLAAQQEYLLSFDNVSSINKQISDCLCSIITGGGYSRKKNYTDEDTINIKQSSPVLMNGIGYSKLPDLAQRFVTIELKRMSDADRKLETDIWKEFESQHPFLLGGLCQALSNTMRALRDGFKRPSALPRLADFAVFAHAAECGNGWPEGVVENAFKRSYETNLDEIIDNNPFFSCLSDYIEEKGDFQGTTLELLNAINERTRENYKRLDEWPKTANGVSMVLRKNGAVLNKMRLLYEYGKKGYHDTKKNTQRVIIVKRIR